MSRKSNEFMGKMLEMLPSAVTEYNGSVEKYGEILETVVIEDIFMPLILELLLENKNVTLLKTLFQYFEEVASCEDEHLINIFSITVLEILGNDKEVLKIARSYMGSNTLKLQQEVEMVLMRG